MPNDNGTVSLEQRLFSSDFELRKDDEGKQFIRGYAAVFNQLSVPLFGFRERIRPGAFKRSIESESDVRALWQHDTARVLARRKNGTLRLWEDERGLAFELEPADTNDGRDAVTLIERGDIDQMSFGFRILPGGDEWEEDEELGVLRELVTVELHEISPVTWAAYPTTDVGVVMRSAPDWVQRALTQDTGDNNRSAARARLQLRRKRLGLQGELT